MHRHTSFVLRALLASVPVLAAALPGGAQAPSALTVRAWVDGRSRLVVTPGSLHWQHFDFAAPGREVGAHEPTFVNGEAWQPEWPDVPDAENRDCHCESSAFAPIPPVTEEGPDVRLFVTRARGPVTLVQRPTVANGHTLIVELDDNEPGSSDWYELTIVPPCDAPQPQAHWSFDACDGGVVPDETQSQRGVTDGAVRNGASCVPWGGGGGYGTAIQLDGIDDAVEVPDHPRLRPTTALTVSAWVRPDTTEGERTIVNKWYALDSYGLFLRGGSFVFKVVFPGGQWGRQVEVVAPAAAGVWTHVAGVFDGDARLARIYVNGELVADAATGARRLQQSKRPLVIGNHPDWNAYQGLIDEVRLYDRALTARQIRALALPPPGR